MGACYGNGTKNPKPRRSSFVREMRDYHERCGDHRSSGPREWAGRVRMSQMRPCNERVGPANAPLGVGRRPTIGLQVSQNSLTQSNGITLAASGVLDDLLGDDLGERVCAIDQP
jgi:hypothetical protein